MYINGEKLKVKRYSSGELRLTKSELNRHIKGQCVELLHTSEENFFELLLIIDYYKNFKTNNDKYNIYNNLCINLILSYLPYQRMDHKGRDELDTLSNVANILNGLNINSITICEPHCDVSEFKNVKEFSYIQNLKQKVYEEINFDKNSDMIVLTDKGGLIRYKDLGENMVYFNKVRDIETGLIVKHEIVGEVDITKKFIIVDDIISTGDTIINIVDYLTNLGVKEIYVFSGHFEKNKYNKRLINHKNIKKIFSTNSLSKCKNKKLKLFDVKELFYGNENN